MRDFLKWLINTDNVLVVIAVVVLGIVMALVWLVLVSMLVFLGHNFLAIVSLFGGPVCVIYVVYLYEQW